MELEEDSIDSLTPSGSAAEVLYPFLACILFLFHYVSKNKATKSVEMKT